VYTNGDDFAGLEPAAAAARAALFIGREIEELLREPLQKLFASRPSEETPCTPPTSPGPDAPAAT
jgi:hypothetical protein